MKLRSSIVALCVLAVLTSLACNSGGMKRMDVTTITAGGVEIPLYTGRLGKDATGEDRTISIVDNATTLSESLAAHGYVAPKCSFADSVAILILDPTATDQSEYLGITFYAPGEINLVENMLYKDGKLTKPGNPSPMVAVAFVPKGWVED